MLPSTVGRQPSAALSHLKATHIKGTSSGHEDQKETRSSRIDKSRRKELRMHSKAKTPLAKLSKLTKRTVGSLRQKAMRLGIKLGHRR